MTVIGSEGFDMYNGSSAETGFQSRWQLVANFGTSLIAGRFGGQALRLVDGTGGAAFTRIDIDLVSTYTTFCFGFAYRRGGLTASQPICIFYTGLGTAAQLYISENTGGTLTVHRGDNTTLITSTNLTVANQWTYVEIAFTIANSGGSVSLWMNNQLQGTFTGDTQQEAAATFRYIELRSPNQTGSGNPSDYDDLYWKDDATPLGEIKITTIRAVGDTADADFVPVGASPNYNCVDETLVDGDTTYVQGSNSGDLDLYEFEDIIGDPSAIHAVQAVMFARKTDAGARDLHMTVKSGATQDDGTAVNLLTTYDRYQRMLPLNPDGSVPWTKASVNALLGGPKIP